MKLIFLPLFILNILFASSAKEVFPTVLSSFSEINLAQAIVLEKTNFLNAKEIINNEQCRLKKFKKNNKVCIKEYGVIQPLAQFQFFATNNTAKLHLENKIQTFIEADLPDLNITMNYTDFTFQAPLNAEGKRVQRIGHITDTARVSTYTFYEGDYYIESLNIHSEHSKRHNRFRIRTRGKVRIFLNNDSSIIKKSSEHKHRGYVKINYNTSASNLLIFAKGKFMIDTSNIFKMKAFLYGYNDITLIGTLDSTVKGAITSKGTLTLGKEDAMHWEDTKVGKYIYYEKELKKLNLKYPMIPMK